MYAIHPRDRETKEEYVEADEDESDEREEGEEPRPISRTDMEQIYKTQNQLLVADSIEHVTGMPRTGDQPIYLNLHFSTAIKEGELEEKEFSTSLFGKIKGMFDSGASINCIRASYAHKYYKKYIKREKDFYCTTANGAIIINEYIPLRVRNSKGEFFITKFYLLRKSPYKYIISRELFTKLGYKIIDPEGNEFNMRSQYEEMDPEFYDEFYKHMEYPQSTPAMKQFIEYIQTHTHRASKQSSELIARRLQTPGYLHDICVIGKDQARTPEEGDPETIIDETIEDPMEDLDYGKIQNTQIHKEFKELIESEEARARNSNNSRDIGTIPGIEFEIKLKPGSKPKALKPYPMNYDQQKIVDGQTQQLYRDRIIRPSKSQFAWPVILVPKPTRKGIKEWRMCVDVRGLNAMTIKDNYRIPSMRDLYRRLSGSKIFSNFDLRSAYYHIPIKEEDRHKTAFIADDGRLWEWNRMAFGFCNAPAVFQRAMDKVFDGLDFVVVYLDDIIVCSKNEKEHLQHLKLVYERLKKYNLKLRILKCKFYMRELKFLGIIVNADGIRCDPGYINQVLKFKKPSNVKEIERFIGMVTWLGRFIPNLSKLTSKLNDLRKKNQPFLWTKEHDRHFNAILRAVSEAKLLRHPDIQRPFFIQTDASDKAIGAVLLQDFGNGILEPIEFISRRFKEAELKWHASEKELVAIVWSLKKWIRYLLPKHFVVFTDHKNLENLFNYTGNKLGKLQRWMIFLQQFDFTAKYLPGKDNFIADYLSRDNIAPFAKEISMMIEETRYQMPIIRIDSTKHQELLNTQLIQEEDDRSYIIPMPAAITSIAKDRSKRNKKHYNKYYGERIWDFESYGKTNPSTYNKNIRTNNIPEIIPRTDKKETGKINKEIEDWSTILRKERLTQEQYKDDEIKKIVNRIKNKQGDEIETDEVGKQISRGELTINNDGLLFKRHKGGYDTFYVPKTCTNDIIRYFHYGNNFYHQGIQRTYNNIKQHFYWKNMFEQIENQVSQCEHCKLKNAKQNKNEGLYHPIMKANPFEQICLDIVGPLPVTSRDNRYLLTIMDRFTRYTEVIPLQYITAEAVADAYIDNWLCRYGPPKEVLSDNGTQFTSQVFNLVQKLSNVKHKFASPYHPQCNGLIERFHRFLKQRLAIKAHTNKLDYFDGDDWDYYIAPITFAFNSTPHPVNKKSPFELLYGTRTRLAIDIPTPTKIKEEYANYDDYVFKLIRKLQIIRNETLRSQYEHQQRMKKKLNKDRKPFTFEIGQWVMKRTINTGNRTKLQFNYQGPYEIVEKTGKGETYKIKEIDGDCVEIVHGERLIKWTKPEGEKIKQKAKQRIDAKIINTMNKILLINTREEKTIRKTTRHIFNIRYGTKTQKPRTKIKK